MTSALDVTTQLKSYLDHPPPQYAEATDVRTKDEKHPKPTDSVNLSNGAWLVRRTSIVVESHVTADDKSISGVSSAGTRADDDASDPSRNRFRRVVSRQDSSDSRRPPPWHACKPFDTGFGTSVYIEAGKPKRAKTEKHLDMKGLEQAASVKRWAGGGRPAESWGKLTKDPELWDPEGDTLVYFGYQRPQPSFRLRSKMLEEVGSEILTSKLQDGRRRPGKASSVTDSSTSSARKSFKNLSLKPEPKPMEVDANVRYEIYFPAPLDASRIDVLRYHITTRNFFALLLAKPLVGLTFYQALIDLHQRLRLYMPGDPNCALIIIKCLMENSLHNVCNDPAAAAGLLAWSEDEGVCWQEGWREGFVHCSGMYSHLRAIPEFRDVSQTSRALLERAHLERQVRLQEAEDHLSDFGFGEMWTENASHLRGIRSSFDRFRKFLHSFYGEQYGFWPPKASRSGEASWLTRRLVLRLQQDSNALYDHFVDKNIIWTNAKTAERGVGPITTKLGSASTGDKDYLLADLFKRYDQKMKYAHIPHPYPLLPASVAADGKSKSLFTSKARATEKRVAHAYSDASNIPVLRKASDFDSNGLVEAFTAFEKTDHPLEVEPRAARQGRWLLLYGLLQALSRVSVDTPDLYFVDNVDYFLGVRLKGGPPWSYGNDPVYEEAEPKMAHVWKDMKI